MIRGQEAQTSTLPTPPTSTPPTPISSDVEILDSVPEWLLTCRLMLLLHKTEKELEEGMSPYIIKRLAWLLQEDSDREAAQQAASEAEQKFKQQMSRR